MLNVDDAIAQLAEMIKTPVAECETLAIGDAAGRVLAEDVTAPLDLPPFDSSAMDGYAVAANGAAKRYRVVDTAYAGHPSQTSVGAGIAVRVFTGSMMPPGADAVILQEDGERDGDWFASSEPVASGDHVRYQGTDIAVGEMLCVAGTRLTPLRLAWFVACGISEVSVRRPVRVAAFSTGDELADPGVPLTPGQIYDSNRFALGAMMRNKAAEVIDLGRVADDPEAIERVLRHAAAGADIVVTSGGVSVGDADYVRDVVERLGSLDYWRVALKPGKPLAVGRIDDALFFGLPGNPISTIITYLLFVAPAIDHLSGASPTAPLTVRATLKGDIRHTPGRREYVRAVAANEGSVLVATPTGDQGSNRLATFADANALIKVPEQRGDLTAGDAVDVVLLGDEASHVLNAGTITRPYS